jgi:ABC-2 type transport system permease protein
MTEVESLCRSLTIVNHGRVVFAGTVNELRDGAPAAAYELRTADDERAKALLPEDIKLDTTGAVGFRLVAAESDLDRYTLLLGREGVALRSLTRHESSLESLFLSLTEAPAPAPSPAPAPAPAPSPSPAPTLHGIVTVFTVECQKLQSQWKVWAVLPVCLVAPLVFVVALKVSGQLPSDTLFGRWALLSGFSVPLIVLGFAPGWAIPALTSIVGGDLLSSEDRYGTWPTLLTRSRTRGELILGKVLTALAFSTLTLLTLGASSLLVGTVVLGHQPLLGLSGAPLLPAQASAMVAVAWLSVLPPAFAFTGLALLVSGASKSSVAGVGLPVVLGFVMDLGSFLVGADVVRRFFVTSSFLGWHGLFGAPRYYGPLVQGTWVSALYLAACLLALRAVVRRRDLGV